MAATISRAGFDTVLWNRDAAKAGRVAEPLGALVASTPAEAAAKADVVLTSLADDAALEAVYLGPEGIVEGIGADAVAVDTSTVDPQAIELSVPRSTRPPPGPRLPVSGSVSLVEAGTLTIMAGGDAELWSEAAGPRRAGRPRDPRRRSRHRRATKLAVNDLVLGLNLAPRGLVLAGGRGRSGDAYEVFASGAGGARSCSTSARPTRT
jgi:hypothetical protein